MFQEGTDCGMDLLPSPAGYLILGKILHLVEMLEFDAGIKSVASVQQI